MNSLKLHPIKWKNYKSPTEINFVLDHNIYRERAKQGGLQWKK